MKIYELFEDASPVPKNRRWGKVGEPIILNLSDLVLDQDGIATAESKFMWSPNYRHQNKDPIAVVLINGKPFVLDGYHRVVQAKKDKQTKILAQLFESKTSLFEARTEFQVLKSNKIPLTKEEREVAMKSGAVWNSSSKPTCAIWKTKNSKNVVYYCSNTHRCWQKDKTLKAAINSFLKYVKPSA